MGTPNPIRLDLDDLGLAPGRCSAAFGRRALRWSERLLLVFGIVCIAYLLYVYVEARLYQTFSTTNNISAEIQRGSQTLQLSYAINP